MKISISFATNRYGWLENTFRCLGSQTLPHEDWELVMIDDVPEDRQKQVLHLAEKENINLKWMRSKPNHWKSNRMLGNARNTGFIHSDGELVVFLDDYTWIEPRFLQWHWEIYKKTGMAVIGRVKIIKFREQVNSIQDCVIIHDDHRFDVLNRQGMSTWMNAHYGWFYTYNASAPLSRVIEVNGYDEEFDCTGEDDIDLGERLHRAGVEYVFVTEREITAYHMRHGGKITPEKCFVCGGLLSAKDRVTRICLECATTDVDKLKSIKAADRYKPEEVHKVAGGHLALLERNKRKEPWHVNHGYFDLSEARKNRDRYPVTISKYRKT